MPALPNLTTTREWLQATPTAITDPQLQAVMDGEAANQFKACRIADEYDRDPDLCNAFLRRVARVLAARGVPLGITAGEQGQMRLASFDAEIDRLEGYDRGFYVG